MAEQRASGWIGPVLGAIILIGGYVAYQQWHEHHAHNQACAALKRAFQNNFASMQGDAEAAIKRSLATKSQAPMAGITGPVAANQSVMDTLDAQCPGWIQKQYD